MKIVEGRINYSPAGMMATKPKTVFLFTGNANNFKANGALVMGRGAAKQVRDLYPGIDSVFGSRIRAFKPERWIDQPPTALKVYGVIYIKGPAQVFKHPKNALLCPMDGAVSEDLCVYITPLHRTLGVFQVKYDFRDQANKELISWSAYKLGEDARDAPDHDFLLNFPGVGNGRLTRAEVEPIIASYLPDNVHVYL